MSKLSMLITTNKKFYIEGDVDDIIYKIQRNPIDSQTGKSTRWFCFYRLVEGMVLNCYQQHITENLDYIHCWERGEKTAVKKSAIKSIVGLRDDALILSAEEIETINQEVRAKEGIDY